MAILEILGAMTLIYIAMYLPEILEVVAAAMMRWLRLDR